MAEAARDPRRWLKQPQETQDRLDDHESRIKRLEGLLTSDRLAGIMHGILANETDELPKEGHGALIAALRELVDKLSRPTTRTSTVHTANGPMTMTTTEERR